MDPLQNTAQQIRSFRIHWKIPYSLSDMVANLPLIKLGGILLRTVTKPIGKSIKVNAKTSPNLKRVCILIGNLQHNLLWRAQLRGISQYQVKPLSDEQALEYGSEFIGETFIFSIAVAVASFEYHKSWTKSELKARAAQAKEAEKQRQWTHDIARLEMRIEALEKSRYTMNEKKRKN